MNQTGNTAIVLRRVDYRESDRLLTLLSPTRGKLEALCRGCRKPKSKLLQAAELFSLGEYDLYEKGGHYTVVSFSPIESFYPLRCDYERLSVGVYLLGLCERGAEEGQNAQELFMLLLHTLSRLSFSNQAWQPLTAGFLLHYAQTLGIKPRLNHCVRCGTSLPEDRNLWFDGMEGGLTCDKCAQRSMTPVSAAEIKWLRTMLQRGSASWLNAPDCHAPLSLLRAYVEARMDIPGRLGDMLPK